MKVSLQEFHNRFGFCVDEDLPFLIGTRGSYTKKIAPLSALMDGSSESYAFLSKRIKQKFSLHELHDLAPYWARDIVSRALFDGDEWIREIDILITVPGVRRVIEEETSTFEATKSIVREATDEVIEELSKHLSLPPIAHLDRSTRENEVTDALRELPDCRLYRAVTQIIIRLLG
jgi:hypothetical protein